ncbi:beta-1,3-galactosyltransferase 1-like [Hyperolius riggenbachi]|uniref:beta-1,3-galactosyltransferase 1-like n=1 Tax=Hyperolius riggenbachi TaxID=752182 RepID=UPI0035A26E7F
MSLAEQENKKKLHGVKYTNASHRWSYPRKKLLKFIIFLIFIAILGYKSNHSKKKDVFSTPDPSRVPQKNISEEPIPLNPLYSYIIEEGRKCVKDPPFLLLLIPSAPQDGLNRSNLRGTWAIETLVRGVRITRLFLLGRSSSQEIQADVNLESHTFHDIIQQDFIDCYQNLTLKTLMGLEWVSRFCPKVSYVMKIDSDMFFNPWFLVEKVLQPSTPAKKNFYTGLVVTGAIPNRQESSKWYMPLSQYSKEVYPPYCSGTGYLFSGDLSEKIYRQAQGLPMFPFEDVFIGMCLENIGVQISKPGGDWFIGEKISYDKCHFVNIVTVHHFRTDELLELWPDFTSALETCRK